MKSFLLVCALSSSLASAAVVESDLCVYGGTSGGVAAAVQAARMGKTVVIAEPGRHLGGMTSGGLSAVDIGDPRSVGGIAREFYGLVYDHYLQPSAWRGDDRADYFERSKKRTYTGKNDALHMQWVYESHVAEKILAGMLQRAGVTVVRSRLLVMKKFKFDWLVLPLFGVAVILGILFALNVYAFYKAIELLRGIRPGLQRVGVPSGAAPDTVRPGRDLPAPCTPRR